VILVAAGVKKIGVAAKGAQQLRKRREEAEGVRTKP
jgi:hypothetical protein